MPGQAATCLRRSTLRSRDTPKNAKMPPIMQRKELWKRNGIGDAILKRSTTCIASKKTVVHNAPRQFQRNVALSKAKMNKIRKRNESFCRKYIKSEIKP